MRQEIGILGAGAFGTALATAFARSGHEVRIWARNEDLVQEINSNHTNAQYAPGAALPTSIRATHDIDELMSQSRLCLYACPSAAIRSFIERFSKHTAGRKEAGEPLFISTAKGLEPKTHRFHHEIAEELLGRAYVRRSYLNLSGPSFASEILQDMPTCLSISGFDWRRVVEVQRGLTGPHLRLYGNTDIIGSQLGGAMKNVIAIGAGLAEGLGLGHNTQAALINLGLSEIARLGKVLGAKTETFLGLSGMGDLVLTCTSAISRNRSFGVLLGRGQSVDQARNEIASTIEGINATSTVIELADKLGVRAPICREVFEILHSKKPVREAFDDLLTQPPGGEWF